MPGTMNRKKQNAETDCHGRSLLSENPSCSWRWASTCLRIHSNRCLISLEITDKRAANRFYVHNTHSLGTLTSGSIYIVPDLLTPIIQLFVILFDILCTFRVKPRIGLDGQFGTVYAT